MDIWNCCRMCLNSKFLNPIFPLLEHHDKYSTLILYCTGIQVNPNDAYPQKICTLCVNSINENYKYRKKCAETQKTLALRLENSEAKIKPEYDIKDIGFAAIDISDLVPLKLDNSDDTAIITNESQLSSPTHFDQLDDDAGDLLIKLDQKMNTLLETDSNNCKNLNCRKGENFDYSTANIAKQKEIMCKKSISKIKNKMEKSMKIPCGKGKNITTCESDIHEANTNLSELPTSKLIKREKRTKGIKPRRREKEKKKDRMREPVECEYCHKILSSRLSIPNHYKIHTGFNIVCEHCGKKFISRRILLMHCRARHGYEKTDKCRFCDYKASNADQVKIHERIHTGEKPFVCKDCGAAFIRSSTYKQHIATHLTEKNVQCDQCPARFKSVTLMKIHKNKHKPNQYVFKCRICNNSFVRRRNVTRHLERIHKMKPEPDLLERVKIGSSELSKP